MLCIVRGCVVRAGVMLILRSRPGLPNSWKACKLMHHLKIVCVIVVHGELGVDCVLRVVVGG